MSSPPDLWLAVEPAHLPHYSHTAVVVGTVIILSIIVLLGGLTLANAWFHRVGWLLSLRRRRGGVRQPRLRAQRDVFAGATANSPMSGRTGDSRRAFQGSQMLSAAELDGFDHQQQRADDQVAAQGDHAESGAQATR